VSAQLRLDPDDEGMHPVEEPPTFQESMYANVLDPLARLGVWVRVGNRPHEGHSEVSCCVYLPDGRVAFGFGRPECSSNDSLAAGGAAFEVVEPFEHLRMTYAGPLLLLDDPLDLADPTAAMLKNRFVDGVVDLDLRGLTTPHGGEPVDGAVDSPLAGFARGHYEQHVRGTGSVTVDGTSYSLDALGLRDHSWGPRLWQNLSWYRFLPLIFDEDFAMSAVLIGDHDGGTHAGGMVLRVGSDGTRGYVPIEDVRITSEYDDADYPLSQRIEVDTAERMYVVEGTSLSMVPLRNRRDGRTTRITEAMTRFTCDGHEGVGMAEYLDQLVDGRPSGRDW
jgi:hypothetical protein